MRPTPLWSDPVLLDRYLTGETTPAERDAIERWLAANPEERHALDAMRAGMVDPYGPIPPYDMDARTAAILDYSVRAARRMRRQSAASEVSLHTDRLDGVARWFGRRRGSSAEDQPLRGGRFATDLLRSAGWAMLVLLLLGIGWQGRRWFTQSTAAPMSAYVTGNGERANITLPDGNTVALGVASRLEVPADYLNGHHTLLLRGVALFTVQHRTGTPLTVIAGDATARVLGTTFMVRHYATDTAALVAVRDGKVSVEGRTGAPVILTTARQVVVGRTARQVAVADPSAFSFAAGVLTLTNTPLANAIPELDRWYDADIRLGDSTLLHRGLTGQYAAGSLSDLVELLEGTYDVRVVRDGRVLTLYRR